MLWVNRYLRVNLSSLCVSNEVPRTSLGAQQLYKELSLMVVSCFLYDKAVRVLEIHVQCKYVQKPKKKIMISKLDIEIYQSNKHLTGHMNNDLIAPTHVCLWHAY